MSTKQQSATHGEHAEDVTKTEQRNHKADIQGGAAAGDVEDTQRDEKHKSEDQGAEAKEVVDTQQNATPYSENSGQETEEEYWDEFISHARDVPWIEICYDSPSKDSVLESIEGKLDGEGPWPFIGRTIEEVYDFHKKFLRPADESKSVDPFTYFTFLVFDDECVNSEPPQCMVCCDAPDYEDPDGEVTLKKIRVPIETAIWMLVPLEQLAMTPSEALEPDGTALASLPPFTQAPVSKPPDETFTVVTFAEARALKREGIRQRDVALKPIAERMMDDERATQLFRVPLKEATVVANGHRLCEMMSREHGAIIRIIPNPRKRSRSEEEENEDEGLEEPNAKGIEKKKPRRE